MGSKIKAWFYGSLISIILCTTTRAGVERRLPQASLSKIYSESFTTRSQFIPFTSEQAQTLLVKPQLFLDGLGPQCGGTVWALEVRDGKKILRCSNQYAIYGDDKIRRKLEALFSDKRPISENETYRLLQKGECSNPSGRILFIVDHTARSASVVVDGQRDLKSVFQSQVAFEAWIQEAYSSMNSASQFQKTAVEDSSLVASTLDVVEDVAYIPGKIAAIGNGLSGAAQVFNRVASSAPVLSHLGKVGGALEFASTHLGTLAGSASKLLGPIGTALAIAQSVGLDEVARNMPKLLYPAGSSEQSKFVIIHGKIVMALLGALTKEQGAESHLENLARMSDCVHFYNVQRGFLPEQWRKKFKQNPQEAIEQLAVESGQNVCCLVVSSGRFVCPNFFQTLYICRQDPVSNQPISEIIRSRGLKDGGVMDSFSEKCTFDDLSQGKTRLFVIDQKANQIYLVSYEPQGMPQFPNIFVPENWNHWRKVFSSLGERLKGTGELLGVSFGKKLRALPVIGNYAADKLGLKHELSSKKAIENTLTVLDHGKMPSSSLPLEGEKSLTDQLIPATKMELGMKGDTSNSLGADNFDDGDFSDSSQNNAYSLEVLKPSEDKRKNWPKQSTHMEAMLYDHPYDGDEYIEEAPEFRFEHRYASGIPLTA